MTLQNKKDTILRLLALGMPQERCFLYAEVTAEENDALRADELFMRRVGFIPLQEEEKLLTKLDTTMEIAAMKGKSDDIRWKLALFDKGRYGSGVGTGSGGSDGKERFKMHFNMKEGTATLETEDNVEVFHGNGEGDQPSDAELD